MTIQKTERTSANIQNDNLEKLYEVFPQFVKDGEIDFDALKAFFDTEGLSVKEEKYGLSWAGKSDAFKAIRMPATGALVPQEREGKDWDATKNLFIEGDNLEVLKLLQKHYRDQVKMIYIDPPYNTSKDFIYKDNFTENKSDYYERTGQSEGGVKLTSNPESNGRYHSDWLTMMYPRLFLAKSLLKDDGVIFVSIDDHEVANLRLVMDEIFGEENFVAQLIWNKQHSQQQGIFKQYHEYVVVYSRNRIEENISGGEGEIVAGALKKVSKANPASEFTFPVGTRVDSEDSVELAGTYGDGEKVTVVSGRFLARDGRLVEEVTLSAGWTQKDQMRSWFSGAETIDTKGQQVLEFFFNSEGKLKSRKSRSKITPPTLLPEFGMVSEQTEALFTLMGGHYFDNPKPVDMIQLLMSWFTKSDDIIFDFFAGSGTTAHAVMAQNAEDGEKRKWICVQIPEEAGEESEARKAGFKTIADISRERVRRAGEKIGKGDVGFKSFALASSNYRQWSVLTEKDDEEKLKAQMKLFADKPLVDGANEESVVYEVLLKEGFDLNAEVRQEKCSSIALWLTTSGDRTAAITLAPNLSREQIDALGLAKGSLFVCLDSALDDSLKVNLSKNFNLKVI